MIDLHSHSYYSDGQLSPHQLLAYAAKCGVKTLALTDHDTVDGIDEALIAAQGLGVNLIPGVEISVSYKKHVVHILGLKVNHKDPALVRGLDRQVALREKRAKLIGERLADVGIVGAFEAACNIAGSRVIARPHFAKFLVENGHARDFNAAFKRYLVRGRPAFVDLQWMDLAEAVNLINNAGGVAVIAHPSRYKFTMTKLSELIIDFKDLGGRGMEVVYNALSLNEIEQLANLCQNHKLLGSCGSDFHAFEYSKSAMGSLRAMPSSCTPVWHDWNLEQ